MKLFRIMRLTFCFMTMVFLQVSARGLAQKITYSGKNVSLTTVFSAIEKQTGYVFFYNNKDLTGSRTVTLSLREATLERALEECFKDQPLNYVLKGNTIFITAKPPLAAKFERIAAPEPPPPVVVHGRVVDEKGQPIAGATVQVKGRTGGTSTNDNGEFEVRDAETNSTLIISFVGYASQEVKAGSGVLMVRMTPSQASMNSVVVVGYGTQKKIDLTGAVDQVGSEYFEERPMPNITRGLQGVLPNLNIKMTDGKPTRGASYNIRGGTSIGAGVTPNALVLIDGVTGDPQNLNPNDIESVTILKDAASAAIYGARAAFGVVLITTKAPRSGKTQINYSSNFSNNRRTTTPDLVTDGYLWAQNYDEAMYSWMDYSSHPANINGQLAFSPAYLDSLKAHKENPSLPKWGLDPSGNYAYYANTDWMKELYKNSNNSMEHSLSVSGGSDRVKLALSGRYYTQDGIFKYNTDDFDKYNFRLKGDIRVSDKFSVNTNVDYTNLTYKYPLTAQGGVNAVWRLLSAAGFPLAPLLNPDGTMTNVGAYSIGDFYEKKSYSKLKLGANRYTVGFTALPFRHLTVKGDLTYITTTSTEERRYFPVSYSIKPGVITNSGLNYLDNFDSTERDIVGNLYASYANSFGDHSLTVLVGGNLESYSMRQRHIRRDGLIVDNVVDWNLATGTNYILTGGGYDWATAGLFSRINYAYKNKYLFQFNSRYDGSSRFPTDQAWGFFPSAEAGWIISKEGFMDNTARWLNLLKIRGSYGSLGNGNIAPYSFVPAIGVSTSTVLQGGIYPNYIRSPNVYPNNITWERVKMANLGMDLAFFSNRLSTTVDVYERNTIGMITVGPPLPAVFGATVPNGNNANMRTRGWELSLNWQDKTGGRKPVSYSFRVTLSDNTSTITKFYNPNKLLNTYYEGYHLGDIWGFQTLGFFKDADDVAKSPNQKNYFQVSSGNNVLPGDLKFADRNGDGFVNIGKNTVADPGDRRIIGNSTPRYAYGFTGDVSWNNFSLSVFVQGIGKRNWMPSTEASFFWGQYNRPYSVLPTLNLNRWTVDNPNLNAYFPRYRGYVALSGTRELAIAQTRYLQNVSYVRLKNVTLQYSLPRGISQKISAESIRVYITGQNLWTYSPMFRITRNFDPEVIEGSDPEINNSGGDGFAYPMEKTFSAGISINF